ncbi:MAG: hypothetical protein IPL83_18060 [Bdellovibrionales bacterium]|nr:hypothetical protein [Bdellovibrionales bacterium]
MIHFFESLSPVPHEGKTSDRVLGIGFIGACLWYLMSHIFFDENELAYGLAFHPMNMIRVAIVFPIAIFALYQLIDSGFNSKSVFNDYFKKRTGMTPSAYKRLHQSEGPRKSPGF